MFCKNCGKPMTVNDNFCTYCNTPKCCGNNYCNSCGNQILPNSVRCGICGNNLINTPFVLPGNLPINYNDSNKGFAIASLVLGLVGIVSSCTLVLPILCGLVGIIMGCIGLRSHTAKGMATAGLVLSIISCALFAFLLFSIIIANGTVDITNEFNQFTPALLK